MKMLHNASYTAVKVRGKRHGTHAEKIQPGQRRKLELRQQPLCSGNFTATTSDASASRLRKRRRRADEEVSRLEVLPPEVLQQIFKYALNISLPMVSRHLALKLSNSLHLQHQMTSLLLRPVLKHADNSIASTEELAQATRLLNSRFMTWKFFCSWLRSLPEASDWLSDASNGTSTRSLADFWLRLQPAPGLLPPKKLLSPPFQQGNISLLAVLAQNVNNINSISPSYGELAYEGLTSAVRQSRIDVVALLLDMGVRGSTELLRVAVADAGCDQDIVRSLFAQPHVHGVSSQTDTHLAESAIDVLDPFLWDWAEKRKADGDSKGEWLMTLFRRVQDSRVVGRQKS